METQHDTYQSPDVVVILCSPAYTPLTGYTGKWLEDVTIPSGVEGHRLTGEAAAFKELIADQAPGERKHITIFCGHGSDDALLGPPHDDEEDIQDRQGNRHSILYSADRFQPNPKVLFAYCCNSANALGTRFQATQDASFLGFNGELFFVLGDDQCMGTLKEIVKQTAEQIIMDQKITETHEDLLKESYQQAYEYYMTGNGRENPYWWLMTMYLLQHKNLVQRHAGMPV